MGIMEFNALLVSNSEYLRPFAISLTRDHETAKDLFQETLYRALVNREKYNVGTNVKAWLYIIMRNIFINSYRREIRLPEITELTAPDILFNTHNYNIESAISAKEIMENVHKLPEVFKQTFLLYNEGFKYQEIAHILKEPLGTVKSRIHFARKILRASIEKN